VHDSSKWSSKIQRPTKEISQQAVQHLQTEHSFFNIIQLQPVMQLSCPQLDMRHLDGCSCPNIKNIMMLRERVQCWLSYHDIIKVSQEHHTIANSHSTKYQTKACWGHVLGGNGL
jgi:hypothetical protein